MVDPRFDPPSLLCGAVNVMRHVRMELRPTQNHIVFSYFCARAYMHAWLPGTCTINTNKMQNLDSHCRMREPPAPSLAVVRATREAESPGSNPAPDRRKKITKKLCCLLLPRARMHARACMHALHIHNTQTHNTFLYSTIIRVYEFGCYLMFNGVSSFFY